WLMVNFIISPLSQVPTILKKQGTFFAISLVGTISLILCLTIPNLFPDWNLNFEEVLIFVSISQFLYLTFLIFWIVWMTRKNSN
ncbi:MAG: hypothetical protein ACK44B_03150, partial [Flavobacteriales bacterium]